MDGDSFGNLTRCWYPLWASVYTPWGGGWTGWPSHVRLWQSWFCDLRMGQSQPGILWATRQSFEGQLGLPHRGTGARHIPTERWQPRPWQIDTVFQPQPGPPSAPRPALSPALGTTWPPREVIYPEALVHAVPPQARI